MPTNFERLIYEILDNDFNLRSNPATNHYGRRGTVQNVDLMAKHNGLSHNTGQFAFVQSKLNIPVFRRGQPFSLKIDFTSSFQLTGNNLRLDFSFGENPLPGTGTLAQLPVTGSAVMPEGKDWGLCVTNKSGNSVSLQVKPSAACPVGIWWLTVVTQPGKEAFKVGQHMYILFNPWCKGDQVFMEKSNWRDEYVLNDRGIVYTAGDYYAKNWSFKQFDPATLTAALHVLEQYGMRDGQRGNAVDVCRALSLKGNEELLWGRWSGSFADGKEPNYWTGSYGILDQYMRTKEIVKYGQCWVFSGMTTSLCRSLGIPCRSVTNYDSAHDKNQDTVIDTVWNLNKNEVRETSDSLWNFHVWNDAWMARPDLPDGYGGWQAVDATAQEPSPHRKYNPKQWCECGPASLEAIKKGEIGLQYDAMFIFSEVNADQRMWMRLADGSTVLKWVLQNSIGTKMLTKAVGEYKEHDVRYNYKFNEGSKEERVTVHRAARVAGAEDKLDKPAPSPIKDDVFFNLMQIDARLIGLALRISVQVENRSGENRTVEVALGAHSVEYTGTATDVLDISVNKNDSPNYRRNVELGTGEKEIVTTVIHPDIYVDKLSYSGHVRIYATGVVKETNQTWMKSHTIVIKKPKLHFEMPNELKAGQEVTVTLKFTNPLKKAISNCSFSVEGSCTTKPISFEFRNVQANEAVSHPIKFTPEKQGACTIMGIFNSNLLNNVAGFKNLQVF